MENAITKESILKSGDLFRHNTGGVYKLQKLPDFGAWSLIMMGHIDNDGCYYHWIRPAKTAFKAFGGKENDFTRTGI
jgi:hypothetical protein